eukprot:gnl/Spiro4/7154_TR3728_c0_g1_i1.p1 gnl/Spiro4/7154_TR3728_c0_g1~~gnl/Spiro4/7154_TR3728_c0_g1_i1.p1  ORF type:complete len:153 (+),score=30.62 gnl/Spiro4/7154_TR3728_c0_g1_i1:30-461(+)
MNPGLPLTLNDLEEYIDTKQALFADLKNLSVRGDADPLTLAEERAAHELTKHELDERRKELNQLLPARDALVALTRKQRCDLKTQATNFENKIQKLATEVADIKCIKDQLYVQLSALQQENEQLRQQLAQQHQLRSSPSSPSV